jgi:hypothetical protein
MEYKPATLREVTDYFDDHMDHLHMLTDYLSDQLDAGSTLEDVLRITDFVVVPQFGVFPLCIKEAIEDSQHAPDWESVEEDVYYVRVFKLLWFVVLVAREPDDYRFEVFPSAQYETVVSKAQYIADSYEEEINEHYYRWRTQTFLNNGHFQKCESQMMLNRIEYDGDFSLSVEPYDFGGDMYARVGQDETQQLFIVVTDYDGDWTLPVPSLIDARTVLLGIWE